MSGIGSAQDGAGPDKLEATNAEWFRFAEETVADATTPDEG
jgi:hypothetical protein